MSCPDEAEFRATKVAITLTRVKQSEFPFLSVLMYSTFVLILFSVSMDKLGGLSVKFKHSLYCSQTIDIQTQFFERFADVDMESRYLRGSFHTAVH